MTVQGRGIPGQVGVDAGTSRARKGTATRALRARSRGWSREVLGSQGDGMAQGACPVDLAEKIERCQLPEKLQIVHRGGGGSRQPSRNARAPEGLQTQCPQGKATGVVP